jgi:hypothetical protein
LESNAQPDQNFATSSVSLQKMMVMIREIKQAAYRLLDWVFDDWMELRGHGDKTLQFIFNDLDPDIEAANREKERKENRPDGRKAGQARVGHGGHRDTERAPRPHDAGHSRRGWRCSLRSLPGLAGGHGGHRSKQPTGD